MQEEILHLLLVIGNLCLRLWTDDLDVAENWNWYIVYGKQSSCDRGREHTIKTSDKYTVLLSIAVWLIIVIVSEFLHTF